MGYTSRLTVAVVCGGLNTTSAYGVDGNVRLARFVYWGPGN